MDWICVKTTEIEELTCDIFVFIDEKPIPVKITFISSKKIYSEDNYSDGFVISYTVSFIKSC